MPLALEGFDVSGAVPEHDPRLEGRQEGLQIIVDASKTAEDFIDVVEKSLDEPLTHRQLTIRHSFLEALPVLVDETSHPKRNKIKQNRTEKYNKICKIE